MLQFLLVSDVVEFLSFSYFLFNSIEVLSWCSFFHFLESWKTIKNTGVEQKVLKILEWKRTPDSEKMKTKTETMLTHYLLQFSRIINRIMCRGRIAYWFLIFDLLWQPITWIIIVLICSTKFSIMTLSCLRRFTFFPFFTEISKRSHMSSHTREIRLNT
jgi:hypothetical protein